jgi:hypothetical protein
VLESGRRVDEFPRGAQEHPPIVDNEHRHGLRHLRHGGTLVRDEGVDKKKRISMARVSALQRSS